MTQDPDYVASLRRVAMPIGHNERHASTWKGLMFTHMQAFDLGRPESVLAPIFRYADEDTPISPIGY